MADSQGHPDKNYILRTKNVKIICYFMRLLITVFSKDTLSILLHMASLLLRSNKFTKVI